MSVRTSSALARIASLPLLAFVFACSSSPPPQAATADPPLDDPSPAASGPSGGAVVKPSSDKVKQGIEAIQREDFAAAKAVLSEARAEVPKDPQAAHYLGVALEALGDVAGAEREYRAALELDPKLVESSANLSAILLDAGKPKDALAVIDRALKLAPKQPDLLLNRALALEGAGQNEAALKAYADAVQARPDDPELRMAYADLLLQARQDDKALEQVRAAASGSEDPEKLAAVAHRFGRLGKFADCIAALDRALKKKPSPELHVRRGVCRHEAKDDPGAQSDYEAALELDGNSAPAHYYLGRHLKERDRKAAEKHLAKVIEITKGEGDLGRAAKQALSDLKRK